jgi:hypothetical protein
MSLEILISKYIDGELTREEDNFLRNLLKDNPSAKQKFDSSVELHLEMLDDAENIKVPADLLRRTEDRIMMEIFKSAPVNPVYNVKNIRRFYLNYINAAAAIIIFFFVGVLSIRDTAFLNFGSFTEKTPIEILKSERDNATEAISPKNEFNKNKLHLKKSKIKEMNTSDKMVSNPVTQQMPSGLFSDAGPVNSKIIEINVSSIPKVVNDEDETNNIVSFKSEPDSKNKTLDKYPNNISKSNPIFSFSNDGNIPLNYFEGFPLEVKEIHLTSFISHDFLRNNIKTHNNTAIMNYSQSISYAINETSRLGLEFGLTQYSYDLNKIIIVSNITASGKKSVEIIDPTDDGSTINIPVKIEQREQLYWGSVFYEHTLFKFSSFSLLGRVGLGASNDGGLGYGLIMANYSVYRGIYLSVGTEGRIFKAQIPSLGYNSLTSSFSIVYGLHLQF